MAEGEGSSRRKLDGAPRAGRRIGVIGHQRLTAAVRAEVLSWLKQNDAIGPGTVVVSTLKPGAPQVVVRCALDRGASLDLIVPSQRYEASFPDATSLDEYRDMKARASSTETLDFPSPTEDAYLAAGKRVIDTCDEVLAVWDGRSARRASGTGNLVEMVKRAGKPATVLWLPKVFLSYRLDDARFVSRVHYLLRKQPHVESYFWGADARPDVPTWMDQVGVALAGSGGLVAFLGPEAGVGQAAEIQQVFQAGRPVCPVVLAPPYPAWAGMINQHHRNVVCEPGDTAAEALSAARKILEFFNRPWIAEDGVPLDYLFDLEKDVIEAYSSGTVPDDKFAQGAPERWPSVPRKPAKMPNPVGEEVIGKRRENAQVMVDARPAVVVSGQGPLTFTEAQPQVKVHLPFKGRDLNVRVLVSGGVAPGTNAVISGIVRRHDTYSRASPHSSLSIEGYLEGLRGLLSGRRTVALSASDRETAHRGGSQLGTSRVGELTGDDLADRSLLERIMGALTGVDILYVIGGDGSMRAAHALATVASDTGHPVSIIGVPKTTDNDILWVWQSFGHLSCVQRARDFLLELHTEVTSNPRLCVIQLFGSDSGFVVANAGLASGVANAVLVPEDAFDIAKVSDHLFGVLESQRAKGEMAHAILLMAETAIPAKPEKYLVDEFVGLAPNERAAVEQFVRAGRRVRGQTPDELRSASMKIVTRILEHDIQSKGGYWRDFRVFSNEPRHLIRAMAPSASDVIYGQRLGANAVDAAMAGFYDCMVSHWLTEYVLVPLELVVLGRKRLPLNGAFWRSVVASTDQPAF